MMLSNASATDSLDVYAIPTQIDEIVFDFRLVPIPYQLLDVIDDHKTAGVAVWVTSDSRFASSLRLSLRQGQEGSECAGSLL
jgi:hypothetical protein